LESSTHTPYLARHCRWNMVGSLPRGMPKVVDYRQTDAQAPNKMVTQDRHKVLSRFGRQEGVIPKSCVWFVLWYVNERWFLEGSPARLI
jgi:hypothetical protein